MYPFIRWAYDVSIHAPNEGSDRLDHTTEVLPSKFQSTLPMKGAPGVSLPPSRASDVSIHAPNEGSDLGQRVVSLFQHVSIHAPNEGSDPSTRSNHDDNLLFQSTLPMKGATPML